MSYYQYSDPWSIQLELTEGCNRRCSFCGIHSLYRDKKEDVRYRFMTTQTAQALSKSMAGWLSKIRLEFALEGEPLLNKNAVEILNIFSNNFPKAQKMMTSNMDMLNKPIKGVFDKQKLYDLFYQGGLNILVSDYYGDEPNDISYHDFFYGIKSIGDEIGIPVYDFYDEPNPENKKVWAYQSTDVKKIVVINNKVDRNINRTLNNQAGNTDPSLIPLEELKKINKELPKQTRCHQPFREMSIKHDGAIALCCMDWQREHIMGKFPEDGSLQTIWNNHHFKLVRDLLYNKRRDLISPCDRCNYHGYKVGLLKGVEITSKVALEDRAKQVKKIQLGEMSKHFNRYATTPFVYDSK